MLSREKTKNITSLLESLINLIHDLHILWGSLCICKYECVRDFLGFFLIGYKEWGFYAGRRYEYFLFLNDFVLRHQYFYTIITQHATLV